LIGIGHYPDLGFEDLSFIAYAFKKGSAVFFSNAWARGLTLYLNNKPITPPMNNTISYRWYQQVWNAGEESAIDTLMSPGIIAHGLTEEVKKNGAAGFKEFYRGFKAEFPRIQVDVQDVICQGDKEASRVQVRATHQSGKEVSFDGMTICRVEDGKIVEAWNCFDFLTMNLQLGQKLVAEAGMNNV
jgi:predicted ester cyclase